VSTDDIALVPLGPLRVGAKDVYPEEPPVHAAIASRQKRERDR
jgi:hypothetical protein